MMTRTITISQGYRQAQDARKHPCLDYPYLGIPDEDEKDLLEEADTLNEKELYL